MNDLITPKMLRGIDRMFFWLAEDVKHCGGGEECQRPLSYWRRNGQLHAVAIFSNPN